MLVDFAQAWILLGDHIASQPHHGSRDLTKRMAELAAECRVPESAVEQGARVLVDQLDLPDEPPNGSADSFRGAMVGRPEHRQRQTVGGHDADRDTRSREREQGRSSAAA